MQKHLEAELQPIRERCAGNERARIEAGRTMEKVRKTLKMGYRV